MLLKHLAVNPLLREAQKRRGVDNIKKVLSPKDFALGCRDDYPQYTFNECENIYEKLFGILEFHEYKKEHGIFSLFHKIAKDALRLEGNGAVCRHSVLQTWRETVHIMGQSVFICAYMAYEDVKGKSNNVRTDFAFSPYASTDNIRLRNMLSLGMAENHFHLKGSAPAFLMSWVCLMNNIKGRDSKHGFNHESMKDLFFRAPTKDADLSLCRLIQIAAHIRIYLHQWLDGSINDSKIPYLVNQMLVRSDSWVANTQSLINAERFLSGANKYDYASKFEDPEKAYAPISGEHRFLYRMFFAIFNKKGVGKKETELVHLFFLVYLIAFIRLRAELVQCNNAVGFHNFAVYQYRKDVFLKKYPKYDLASVKMAFDSVLNQRFMRSLEARFTPSPDFSAFCRTLIGLEKMVGTSSGNSVSRTNIAKSFKMFSLQDIEKYLEDAKNSRRKQDVAFVLHLTKKPDDAFKKSTKQVLRNSRPIRSRHFFQQKKTYGPQIDNIIKVRGGNHPVSNRIYGIDAASNELYARPEVFAYLFRKLRYKSTVLQNQFLSDIPKPSLRITYHAGEDFFDIVSGLRAINEAILFMEFGHGDRIGHALALGIEPLDYYKIKDNKLFLSRQELLDNLVWLSYTLRKYGLFDSAVESHLTTHIQEHFRWLYRANVKLNSDNHTMGRDTYMSAWYLRGDNPAFYEHYAIKGEDNDKFKQKIAMAEPWDLMRDEKTAGIRDKDLQARQLMHHYHFDIEIRNVGNEIVEFDIPAGYANVVRALQDEMLREISVMGIGIETNPSSNYLIGTFKQYQKHPLLRFYNKHLQTIENPTQAFVSINTDDQGVFDTDLENEFALMASALENVTDDQGRLMYSEANILKWLDEIRQMGLEQSFALTHKHLTSGR